MPRRSPTQLRSLKITPNYLEHAEGSVLIELGSTKVICTASIDEKVPPWMMNKGKGWVTAEYDMLPRATNTRRQRDSHKGQINGRTQEISRLIGRGLRAVVDMSLLGERTIAIDCDVIQADGGTRTASLTGGYVALALALRWLQGEGRLKQSPLRDTVCAISVGIIDGEPQLDLDYQMDSRADVDMNVVMTGAGALVEVQGTAEGNPFSKAQLDAMLEYALQSLPIITDVQRRAIEVKLGATGTTIEAK